MPYTFTDAAVSLIEKLEGLELHAYRDSGGVLTIGYGHTGPEVWAGMVISQDKAKELLLQDLETSENEVIKVIGRGNSQQNLLTQNQYSALVIFIYNIGEGAFENSTLAAYLNKIPITSAVASNYVIQQMKRWNKVKGVVVEGLINRREAEVELWNTPDAPSSTAVPSSIVPVS